MLVQSFNMSGIHRFLTRRDKRPNDAHQKKVKSPSYMSPSPSIPQASLQPIPSSSSSSLSVAPTSSSSHLSSSSFSSLCLAYPEPHGKGSPHLQATQSVIHSSTANSSNDLILQPRLFSGDLYHFVSAAEKQKKPTKDEDKKIKLLMARLRKAGITTLQEPQIEYALRADFAKGDPEKAFDLLMLYEESLEGILKEFDPRVKLLGAENRGKVTCYLDALLFAMFARLDSFEAMLYKPFSDEPQNELAALLRMWVNMLRLGKLITTDITKHLQDSLAACGWKEAAELRQQDASEAFTFITEKLELPLLTLKMDIYHTGKEDETDDHKFINERLLEVAIPSALEDGKVLTLEDCLEAYFNNRIEVKRHMERQATVSSRASQDSGKAQIAHIETVDLGSHPSTPVDQFSPTSSPLSHTLSSSTSRPNRSKSIIRERVVWEEESSASVPDGDGKDPQDVPPKVRRRNTIRKEVMMPAWQFFSLIPWYTDNAPTSDAQIAAHFSAKRPVLGLCLKRYSMLPNGKAVRLNTYVDIPLEIGLPHFIQDDQMEDHGPLYGNFKLSLQSAVCHRGVSVASGHYISLVRGDAPNANATSSGYVNGKEPRELEEDRWMMFDDLAKERVTYIDIKKVLKEESPYLLFYQVQPIDEGPPIVVDGDAPPPYAESMAEEPDVITDGLQSEGESPLTPVSRKPSLDLSPSAELDNQPRTSGEKRQSAFFADNHTAPEARTSRGFDRSPTTSSSQQPSKASSKTDGQNRSTSQLAEGRLGATLSRLTERMSREKVEPAVGERVNHADQAEPAAEAAKGKGKKEKDAKKEKGKRRPQSEGDGQDLLKNKNVPDRECVVM